MPGRKPDAHQMRQGFGIELLHYVYAMRFHRARADAQLARNLLIGQTIDDHGHHLFFSRREQFDEGRMLAGFAQRKIVGVGGFGKLLNALEHCLRRKRLLHEIHCAETHRRNRMLDIAVGAHHDHAHGRVLCHQLFLQSETVHILEAQIDERAAAIGRAHVKKGFGAGIALDLVTGIAQKTFQRFTDRWIIVHDMYDKRHLAPIFGKRCDFCRRRSF